MIQETLYKLRRGEVLTTAETENFLTELVDGNVTPAQTGAFLMGLAIRGETADEILGAARVLRANVAPIIAPPGAIDCCGTGGDHSNTLNISSAVSFVVAGCGVPVAKHGNRAASSKSGAADVLEAMGMNLNLTPDQCAQSLERTNYCFLMAPHHHHVLKPLAALRRELGFRTIFNLLGPLANPADTKIQLVGVFDRKLLRSYAEVLQQLGTESAMVVHGSDGLDEITLTGPTYTTVLKDGVITEKTLTPEDFGLPVIATADIIGGDAKTNADALFALLEGKKSAYRNIVLANAAAALTISGKAPTLPDAVTLAVNSIDSGNAMRVFTDARDYARICA